MTTPIIFKITEAGKNAILDIDNIGLTLRLSHFAIGSGKYTHTGNETQLNSEISRHVISAGDIERTTHTLRFSTSLMANNETEVYEVGIFTQDNVLFALASSESQPFFKIYPDVAFVASFGLMLNEFDDISRVSIITDPNGALSLQLMQQHLASPDPHPQYAFRSVVEQVTNDIITSLRAEIEALKARPIIPIGGLFITTKHYKNGEAVTADLGYGKWMRALIGRTGVGFDPNASDWTGTMGQKYGSNEHQLTIEEMPSHKHSHGEVFTMFGAKASDSNHITTITSHDRNATGAEYGVGNMSNTDWNNAKERTIGGNRPHNNVQKSEVIAYWQRMPDNYVRLEPIIDVYFTSDKQGKRKITEINEGQNAYLWVEAQNLLSEIEIGAKIDTQNKNINIHKANLAFPNTIDNGKIRIGDIGKITVAEDVTLKMGINYLHDTSKEFLADLLVKDITKRITLKLGLIKQTYHNTEVVMISTHTIASNSDDSDYLPQFVEFDADGNRSLGADIAKKTEVYQLNFSTGDYKAFRNPRLYDIWFYLPTTLPIEQINISSSEELFGYRLERYTGVYNGFYPDNLPPALRTQSRDWIILRADDRLEVPVYTSLHRIPVYINIDF